MEFRHRRQALPAFLVRSGLSSRCRLNVQSEFQSPILDRRLQQRCDLGSHRSNSDRCIAGRVIKAIPTLVTDVSSWTTQEYELGAPATVLHAAKLEPTVSTATSPYNLLRFGGFAPPWTSRGSYVFTASLPTLLGDHSDLLYAQCITGYVQHPLYLGMVARV